MDELMIKVVGVNLTSGFGLFGGSLSLCLQFWLHPREVTFQEVTFWSGSRFACGCGM